MLTTTIFRRKSFNIEAILVTAENVKEVAEWCEGEIAVMPRSINGQRSGIKLKVHGNRGQLRDTYAIVGNWVAKTDRGYKVYTDKAFRLNFEDGDSNIARDATIALVQKKLQDLIDRQERRVIIGMADVEEDRRYTKQLAEEIYLIV